MPCIDFDQAQICTQVNTSFQSLVTQCKRTFDDLTMFYKISSSFVKTSFEIMLTGFPKRKAGHVFKFLHQPASVNVHKNSFFPRTIPVSNSLPVAMKLSRNSAFYSKRFLVSTFSLPHIQSLLLTALKHIWTFTCTLYGNCTDTRNLQIKLQVWLRLSMSTAFQFQYLYILRALRIRVPYTC